MDIDEHDYILAIWTLDVCGEINQLISAVRKKDKWACQCRIRVIMDDKVFNSKDKKSFYDMNIKPDATEDEVFEKLQRMHEKALDAMRSHYQDKEIRTEVIEVRGGVERFLEVCKTSKFLHAKEIKEKPE